MPISFKIIPREDITKMPNIDGIVYNLDSPSAGTATVGNNSGASGVKVIPATVSDGTTSYTVVAIGNNAFYDCRGLTSLTIPASVTSIGNRAFEYCTELTSLTIGSGVTSIEVYAFAYCAGLTSLTIPSSVTSIDETAFYGCSGLTSLTIGSGVTRIGDEAFAYCSGLTSVTIPASVTSIGYYAFYGCSKLTSMSFLSDAPPAIKNVLGNEIYSGPNYVMFSNSNYPTIYVRAGTGWGNTWMGANVSKPILPTVVKHNYTVYFHK